MNAGELERIRAAARPVVVAEGYELVDVEIKGGPNTRVIALYIDKEGGVTHEDCAQISSQVGLVFEAEETIRSAYTMEVSSPGLTRALKRPADFIREKGKLAQLKLRAPVGKSNNLLVTIDDADENKVTVTVKDSGEKATLDYSDIARANLEIEF
ncbi:FIG000325: clustered with transcription termination protein NusA [hydrothermal vent metagenome]|uniref:FIG000325: clustered with transcription termination protein NusA n=1 Tax=hydrothermal vent metagenome TaxID=652676 RepID=A0A3B1BZY1_9ZZZZ